ncbi:MAG: hypothetical protein LBF17_03940 [Mediterranea sp.]|nr:hypothetical protein [Mediterranea sp.]
MKTKRRLTILVLRVGGFLSVWMVLRVIVVTIILLGKTQPVQRGLPVTRVALTGVLVMIMAFTLRPV